MPEARKHERSKKSQLGQFFTPMPIAEAIVAQVPFTIDSKVLEPCCGNGSFVRAIIHKYDYLYSKNHRLNSQDRLSRTLDRNLWTAEIDPHVFHVCQRSIEDWYQTKRWGVSFSSPNWGHHFTLSNFLLQRFDHKFDFIIGNPPFGGTIDYEHQNQLEKQYGKRGPKNCWKIKKESYSFFIVKCAELLEPNGELWFICSDSFLTIKTMSGLRQYLMSEGSVEIRRMNFFSEETDYPMVLLRFKKNGPSDSVLLDGEEILKKNIEMTGNFSWTITSEVAQYFEKDKIGDYMVCSSGMTTGKNKYFVRDITDGTISEPYDFEFFDDPITLENELRRARLNKLSEAKQAEIKEMESQGQTRRNVRLVEKENPETVELPHPSYCYYNKASNRIFYEHPRHAIFWEDDGDAVYTFKKNGNWYLHGVGGKPFFKREAITWGLISTKIKARYLPEGYILDSGAP